MKLSKYFTLEEMTRTTHPFDNIPNQTEIAALEFLCKQALDKIREQFGAVRISSGYRNDETNRSVGGASNSQHKKGEAADIIFKGMNKDSFNWIVQNVPFDQLIWEFGTDKQPSWIHISLKKIGNRQEVLRKEHGKPYYKWKK